MIVFPFLPLQRCTHFNISAFSLFGFMETFGTFTSQREKGMWNLPLFKKKNVTLTLFFKPSRQSSSCVAFEAAADQNLLPPRFPHLPAEITHEG